MAYTADSRNDDTVFSTMEPVSQESRGNQVRKKF